MTADTDLVRLDGAAAEARGRVRVGAMTFGASVAAFALSWVALDKAIMMAIVLAFSAGGLIGGVALMLEGTVRGAVVRRQIRACKQLPAARIVER